MCPASEAVVEARRPMRLSRLFRDHDRRSESYEPQSANINQRSAREVNIDMAYA
jgi:hypothetical protein